MIRRLMHRLCTWRARYWAAEARLQGAALCLAIARMDQPAIDEFKGYLTMCREKATWWTNRAMEYRS